MGGGSGMLVMGGGGGGSGDFEMAGEIPLDGLFMELEC